MTASRRPLPANFRAEALRQTREAQRLRGMLAVEAKRIHLYSSWLLKGADWESLRAACGPGEFGALAERVGLDPSKSTAREVFLTALSTVSTYDSAWSLVLRFSAGADHKMFLDIWRLEKGVNNFARLIFRDSSYLYRGESVIETIGAHEGTAEAGRNHSFVSLTSNPTVATDFAFVNYAKYSETTVVLAINTHEALKAGIVPATYSLASDALDLRRSDESTSRTFPLENAFELQAHFHIRWPAGSGMTMVAIITVFRPTDEERRQLEITGLPIIHFTDIFPRDG